MDVDKEAEEIGKLVLRDLREIRSKQQKEKTSCQIMLEAIPDESNAVKMYEDLIHALDREGNLTPELEHIINGIIDQEASHGRYFKKLKDDLECHILMSYGRKITEFKKR